MTIQNDTTTEAPVRVPQLMATLLLLQAEHKLPDPVSMEATLSNHCAGIQVTSRFELDAWRSALPTGPYERIDVFEQTLNGVDYEIHHFTLRHWGWFIQFDAHVPVGSGRDSEPLPAETLAVLAEVAA